MSRVRVSHQPGDLGWFDEGAQPHVSRSARYTIGGSLVTEQSFGPSQRIQSAAETEYLRMRRERNADAAALYRARKAS